MSSETVYYDINQKRFIYNTTGVELTLKDYPSITFKEQKVITWYIGSWNFTTNAWVATNLTTFSVTAWQSSVDYDFLTATDPMVRVLNTNIDSSNSATGIIVVTYDADTTAFEDAVEAQTSGQRQIYIELKGYNVSGKLAFFARPRLAQIYGEMQLDPGTDPTGTTATNYYTKSEVDAKIITTKQAVSIADSATSNLTLFDHTLTSGCTFEFVFSDTVNSNRISGKISIETDHTIRVNDLEHDYNSTEVITVTIGAFDLSGNNVRFNITNGSGNTITGELTVKDTVVVSASVAATTITVTDEHADTTSFPLFASSATGTDIVPHTNSGLTYDAHTYNLTTTTFTGALSGNATTATTAGKVTTNANLTGTVTSAGNATSIASGAIKGNMLQAAPTDLGAANVLADLSNSNGSYTTSIKVNGYISCAYIQDVVSGVYCDYFYSTTSGSYATINIASTGILLTRNRADAVSACTIRQVHASSTGDVLKIMKGASTALAGFDLSGNLRFDIAAAGITLKQGANGRVGTFTCNGTTPVTVSNTSVAISDAIIISLNTVGGTVGATPAIKTITASTGFTVAGTASDTSVYNYAIIKNAA